MEKTRFKVRDRCNGGCEEEVWVYIKGKVRGIREGEVLEVEEMLRLREGRKVYVETGDGREVEWR